MESRTPTILLVEDEVIIAMDEAALLGRHGFEVVTAASGEEAIEAAETRNVDLILLDIDLGRGKMDGTEAARTILSRREVPIVFLTNHTEQEYVERAARITPYGYVLKSAGEFVLVRSIHVAFELFHARMGQKAEIEHRERIETELRDQNAELSAIYDHTPFLMLVVDERRRVKRTNAEAASFASRSEAEMKGQSAGEALRCLYHLDDPQGCGFGTRCASCVIRKTVLSTLETRTGYRGVEARLPILRHGRRSDAALLVSTAYVELAGTAHAIISMEDITGLKESERSLRQSVERFQRCYHGMPVMLHSIDAEGRLIDVNDAWLEKLGYQRTEVLGRKSVEFLTASSRARAEQCALPDFFERGVAKDVPFEMVTKNGEVLPVLLSAVAERDEEGRFLRSVAFVVELQKRADSRTQPQLGRT
jgi:PAS domain S-box-containing protein